MNNEKRTYITSWILYGMFFVPCTVGIFSTFGILNVVDRISPALMVLLAIDIFVLIAEVIVSCYLYKDIKTVISIKSGDFKLEIQYYALLNHFIFWTFIAFMAYIIKECIAANKIVIAMLAVIIAYLAIVSFEKQIVRFVSLYAKKLLEESNKKNHE